MANTMLISSTQWVAGEVVPPRAGTAHVRQWCGAAGSWSLAGVNEAAVQRSERDDE